METAIHNNVILNVEKLRNSSPVLAELVQTERVRVVGAVYDLATGRINVVI